MNKEQLFSSMNFPTIDVIHDEALIQEFIDGIGKKVLILTPSYPFVFIGKITNVIEDHVVVDVAVTTIGSLENREWNIHVHNIEVYYIERKGFPRIPELKDDL